MMIQRFLLLLASALCLGACSGPKQGPKEAAAEFFEKCAAGKTSEAYNSTSKIFQLERTEKYFEARVRDLGLDQLKSATWSEPEAKGDTRRVSGDLVVQDGRTLNLAVTLAQEGGQWRVLNVKEGKGDAKSEDVFAVMARSKDTQAEREKAFLEPVATAMPSERQLQQLVDKTLVDFQDAVKKNDFREFFATVSDRWKYRGKDPRLLNYTGTDRARIEESDPFNKAQRLTVEALRANFGPFVAANVDLTPVLGKKMILTSPAHITSDGVLTLVGYYREFVFQGGFNAQSRRLNFKLEYVMEGSSWRLFGITLKLEQPPGVTNGR
jgi:hypothetical protein